MTVVGDIYSWRRARVQGYPAVCWASSVIRPLLGGVFSQLGIWRGVFLINIPLSCRSGCSTGTTTDDRAPASEHRLSGALLLACAMTSLILAILGGGQSGMGLCASISAFSVGGVLLASFVFVERGHQAVLPLWVYSAGCCARQPRRLVSAPPDGLTSTCRPIGGSRVKPVVAGLALAALPSAGRPPRASPDSVPALGVQEDCGGGHHDS
jgi:hypothetical protein